MSNHYYGNNKLYIIQALIACIIVLVLYVPPTFAQDLGEEETYDVILEVKRDRDVLSNAIFGLQKNDKYYVPIEALANVVKYNAKTSLSNGTVSGFFGSEDNTYSLNLKQKTFTRRGQSYEFDSSDAITLTQQFGIGDIYVTPELLNKIWPLDLSLDPLIQVLEIQTQQKLPYELAASRQKNRNSRLNKNSKDGDVNLNLSKINNHYKSFSLPVLDFTSTTSLNDGFGQTLNIRGRNDFLKTQASYNFGFSKNPGDQARFENARLLFERQSYDKGDLPLGLQLLQLGDIRPRQSRLIDGVLTGRGLLISSEPQKQIINFDEITVEGTTEPGWEVELYRNNELIGFQIVDDQGEYRFQNVSLNFNNTVIRTVFYGPEGQVREEEETYNIANSMLSRGKTVFEASVLDVNRDLIQTSNRRRNAPEGIGANYKLKRGISSWLSGFTTFTSTPTQEGDRNYGTLGVNLSLFGASGLAEIYQDFSGGTAYDLRLAGNYAGTNINLRNSIFSNFESEEAEFGDLARTSRTELSLSRPFKSKFGSLGLRFNADHEEFEGIDDRTEFDFSQSFARNRFRITHGNTIDLIDKNHQRTDGRVSTTYRINPNWQTRSLLNYDISPNLELRNMRSEIRYRDNKKFTASLDSDRNFQNQNFQFGGQASYDFDKFRTGLNVDWNEQDGFRSFLRTTLSAAPYGKNNNYILSSQNLSSRSALNANVFLDKDYNGVFSEGDEIIKDAKVDIGRRETNPSDASGHAQYLGPARDDYENITLNNESLENPFLIPNQSGYRSLLRPATVISADFPVIETGIIDGIISTNTGALAGVRMELLQDGNVINTTSTAFDGYYNFEYIKPGLYTIRIDPSYEQVRIPPKEISVTSETLFQSGIDFQILEQADEVDCANGTRDGRITQKCPNTIAQAGNTQPASLFPTHNNAPRVDKIRMAERPTFLRLVLDYDKPPSPYQVSIAKDNKEITVIFTNAQWNVGAFWENNESKILKSYSIEKLENGSIKMIFKPVDTINVKYSEILEPDHTGGHRIYFDFIK